MKHIKITALILTLALAFSAPGLLAMPAFAATSDITVKEADTAIDAAEMSQAADNGDPESIFQKMRLMVVADEKPRIMSYGADNAVYYDNHYILSYDSEDEAATAYEKLTADYGKSNVLIDFNVHIADANVPNGWGTSFMNLDAQVQRLQSSKQTSNKVKVAIIDTGIYAEHDIFKGKTIAYQQNLLLKKTQNAGKATDDHGHGTGVAGIIAESTPDNVEFIILKALNKKGEGSVEDVMRALDIAREQGADIANLSLIGPASDIVDDEGMTEEEYKAAYENAMAFYKKKFNYYMSSADPMTIICAAGNERYDLGKEGEEMFPSSFDEPIVVSAIAKSQIRASYSNYGDAVDFTAPGSSVTLATIGSRSAIKTASGTSFASPYIVAAAALIKSEHPSYGSHEIEVALVEISKDLGDKGKDIYYGNGCPIFEGSSAYNTSTTVVQKASNNATTNNITTNNISTKFKTLKGKKKALAVKWQKKTGISGYQLQYSTSKSFAKKKTKTIKNATRTKVTIKKLKTKKKYYLRIRTYKQVNGKKYYSKWSAKKTIRTK